MLTLKTQILLLLSGKNKLKVCNPFVYGKYKYFYSVGACISITNSKHYKKCNIKDDFDYIQNTLIKWQTSDTIIVPFQFEQTGSEYMLY